MSLNNNVTVYLSKVLTEIQKLHKKNSEEEINEDADIAHRLAERAQKIGYNQAINDIVDILSKVEKESV